MRAGETPGQPLSPAPARGWEGAVGFQVAELAGQWGVWGGKLQANGETGGRG